MMTVGSRHTGVLTKPFWVVWAGAKLGAGRWGCPAVARSVNAFAREQEFNTCVLFLTNAHMNAHWCRIKHARFLKKCLELWRTASLFCLSFLFVVVYIRYDAMRNNKELIQQTIVQNIKQFILVLIVISTHPSQLNTITTLSHSGSSDLAKWRSVAAAGNSTNSWPCSVWPPSG